MTEYCNHPNVEVLAEAENCDDGARVLRLQLRCTCCQRLVVFRGFPDHPRPGQPVASLGGRAVTLPFGFHGSYMGG